MMVGPHGHAHYRIFHLEEAVVGGGGWIEQHGRQVGRTELYGASLKNRSQRTRQGLFQTVSHIPGQ
ncbi:MAG: hypothetical protein JXR89_06615 [Deltaproteobacteria bacterium]|nr:hypothetical protein [Deltaproteobacteria bacterium]